MLESLTPQVASTIGMSLPPPVTRLLLDWSEGNERARDEMLPLVYDELRRLAASYLLREAELAGCSSVPWSARHRESRKRLTRLHLACRVGHSGVRT